jgi:hypothetical protein
MTGINTYKIKFRQGRCRTFGLSQRHLHRAPKVSRRNEVEGCAQKVLRCGCAPINGPQRGILHS